MRKLIWLTLIAAILVSSTLIVSNVKASTPVSGTINQDTTWTIANSPYLLTGFVTVNSGVTLTVEPGVTVDLSSYSLLVGGTLNAKGASDKEIVFQTSYWYSSVRVQFLSTSTNWKSSEGSGCIVDNAIFNSAGITVGGSSPKISNNYFTNNKITAVSVSGGSVLIMNNLFDCQSTAISISSGSSASPTISFNFIKNSVTTNYGISAGNNNAYISDNNITGCYMGVYATGNSTISRNLITNNTIGIYAYNPLVTIQNNIIANNSAGIMGGGTIQNNTIGNNGVGVSLAITPCNINQNNFLNNKQYNVGTTTSNNTDATNNWWGTNDVAAINQTIYDSKNSTTSLTLGIVNFTPFLPQPNTQAPALESINYTPNPTPTPYPTTIPAPTNTPYPYPTNYVTSRPNMTIAPIVTPTPSTIPTITPTPSPTPLPTPSPTPKIMPGSPLSLGGSSFAEAIALFDITNIAKIVLVVLGIIWAAILLVFVVRKFVKPERETK